MADTEDVIKLARKLNRDLEEMDIFGQIAVVNVLLQLVTQRSHVMAKQLADQEQKLAEEIAGKVPIVSAHLLRKQ